MLPIASLWVSWLTGKSAGKPAGKCDGDPMPLTDLECRKAAAEDKPRKLADGKGLYLLVSRAGTKTWTFAYRDADGRQREIRFGEFPKVSLAGARKRRDEAREHIEAGRDPRNPEAEIEVTGPTFKEVAERWLNGQAPNWVAKHVDTVTTRLENDVFPLIGHKVARTISGADVLAIVRAIEARGSLNVSRKVRQTISQIFAYGIAEGSASTNPAADIKAAAKPAPRPRHHAKVTDLADFLRRVRSYDGEPTTALAIEMVLRSAVRTSEILMATRDEIVGDLWRIPSSRMKERQEHLVPLTPQMLDIIEKAKEISGGSKLLFPGDLDPNRPMSANTLLFALYRVGLRGRATIHGLRGTFSTAANESGLWARDWIEMQLAHSESNQVRGAYNSALYLAQRREMMTWWNFEIDKAISSLST